jgi:hypothetical protein
MGDIRNTKKTRLILVLCIGALALGVMSAVALAGPTHVTAAAGQSTGQHGQECPPGYHDNNGTCEHNGSGGGNCGDNQSGNNNGHGNNGNDNGFGHNGDCEATTTTTPTTATTSTTTTTTPTTTTTKPPTPTNPTTPTTPTSGTTPSGTTTTGPFTPPDPCARTLFVRTTRFVVGQKTVLVVRVRGADGQPVAGVTVLVRGAGVDLEATTNASGAARLVVRPRSAGAIRISLGQPASCPSLSRLARAVGVFKPPTPNFTG